MFTDVYDHVHVGSTFQRVIVKSVSYSVRAVCNLDHIPHAIMGAAPETNRLQHQQLKAAWAQYVISKFRIGLGV